MSTDGPARDKSGVELRGIQGQRSEWELRPAGETRLPGRSVVVLRDLGMSHETIVTYSRRFPTPPLPAIDALALVVGVDSSALNFSRIET